MKKIISFLCIAALLMGMMPFAAVSEEKKAEPYYSSEALDLYFYSDGEHTMPISNGDEIELFETVFYKAECKEGYYLSALNLKAADVNGTSFSYTGSPEVYAECVLAGDYDSSGKVNLTDATWILKLIAGWAGSPSWTVTANDAAADVNRNGAVNLMDVSALLKIIAQWGNPHGGVQTDFEVSSSENLDFPYESDKQSFGNGDAIEGAGCNLGDSFTIPGTSGATNISADEFAGVLENGGNGIFRVDDTVILDGCKNYDGDGITLVGNVAISGGEGGSLSNIKIIGEITVYSPRFVLYGLVIVGNIYVSSDGVSVTNCHITSDYGVRISMADGVVVRGNTFDGSENGSCVRIIESENVLVCLNVMKTATQSVAIVQSKNCSVILNSIVSVYTVLSSNIYVIDNALGGRFVSRTGQYMICDGNIYPDDGLDHRPILDRVVKVNGDTLTDTSARTDVGAEENLIPHTNKDLFVGMDRQDVIGGVSFTEYVKKSLADDDVVIIPPGAYTVSESLVLEGIEDKKIYAYGVLEEFTDYPLGNKFSGCDDMSISGITVGYSKQSSGQVYVLLAPKGTNQIKTVTAAGYVNDYGVTNTELFFINTQESDVYKAGALNSHTSIAYRTASKLNDGTILMELDSDEYGIEAGDVICCRLAHGSYTTIQLTSCTDVQFRDMVTYGTADGICLAASGKTSGVSADRWHNTTRSAPVIDEETYARYTELEKKYGIDLEISIDGDGRYRGSIPRIGSIDATHINGAESGLTVTNSLFENMCDDGSNHRGSSSRLHDVKIREDGVTELYYKSSMPEWYALHSTLTSGVFCEPFEIGQNILVYTPDGQVFCDTEVLSAAEYIETVEFTLDGVKRQLYAPVYKVTVDSSATDPDALFDDDGVLKYDLSENHYRMDNKVIVDNLSRVSAGFIFDNVVVQNIRSRGLCIKTTDATVKNCTFRNIGNGLLLHFESEWGESTVARDVLIKDCLFENTGYLYGDYRELRYAPISIMGPDTLSLGDSVPCRNIVIEGCSFRNTAHVYHIVVRNAENITVKDNDFGYIYDHEYDEHVRPDASVSIENARNVEISGNSCPDGVNMSDWIKWENSQNVFGEDVF